MDKKIYKETIIYFIGTMIVAGLSFILSLLYSNMFSPYDYGLYSLAFSTYSLISELYGGWMIQSLLRNSNEYKKNNMIDKLYGTYFKSHIILSIIFLIIFNLIILILNININLKIMFLILSIIYFFEKQLLITNTILRTDNNSKQYSINNMLNSLFKIIFVLILYYIMNYKNILVILISLLLSEIIQCIYLFIKLKLFKYYKNGLFSFDILKKMFIFGFPLIGVAVTSWILNVSDRYIITYFYSSTEVGIYSYAYTLANSLFSLLIQFIMLGAYPNIVKVWNEEGKSKAIELIKKYLNLYFTIMIPICFLVILLSKDFFQVFTNSNYNDGYITFIIVGLSITILGISQYTNKVWELNNKTKIILLLNIIAAILNIILNFIFIPVFGYVAAAYTTLFSYIVYLILSIVLSKKYMKIEVDLNYLLKILTSTVLMIIIVLFIRNILNVSPFFKLILTALIGIIVYAISLFIFKKIKRGE